MKTRLNITIENDLLMKIKRLAKKRKVSVSRLIEEHFKTLVRPTKRRNILELIDELPPPKVPLPKGDLVKLYYEDRKKKYGF
jgi:hypothetical protein